MVGKFCTQCTPYVHLMFTVCRSSLFIVNFDLFFLTEVFKTRLLYMKKAINYDGLERHAHENRLHLSHRKYTTKSLKCNRYLQKNVAYKAEYNNHRLYGGDRLGEDSEKTRATLGEDFVSSQFFYFAA